MESRKNSIKKAIADKLNQGIEQQRILTSIHASFLIKLNNQIYHSRRRTKIEILDMCVFITTQKGHRSIHLSVRKLKTTRR